MVEFSEEMTAVKFGAQFNIICCHAFARSGLRSNQITQTIIGMVKIRLRKKFRKFPFYRTITLAGGLSPPPRPLQNDAKIGEDSEKHQK